MLLREGICERIPGRHRVDEARLRRTMERMGGALARFFVGSVAEEVARRSTVPVMTVRPCDDNAKTAA